MSLRGMLLRLSYQLSRHYIGALPAGAWIALAGLAVLAFGLLPRIRMAPAVMIAGGLLALLTLLLLAWGRMSRFLHFRASPPGPEPAPVQGAMHGLDHVQVRATGKFSVEGKERFFANLEAIYHSFESREHAVMAHVPVTRFLLLAQSPKHDAGMWYVFFKPGQIARLERGTLAGSRHSKPAIKCVYRGEKRLEEVYLAFEREEDLLKVAADLAHDAPNG